MIRQSFKRSFYFNFFLSQEALGHHIGLLYHGNHKNTMNQMLIGLNFKHMWFGAF